MANGKQERQESLLVSPFPPRLTYSLIKTRGIYLISGSWREGKISCRKLLYIFWENLLCNVPCLWVAENDIFLLTLLLPGAHGEREENGMWSKHKNPCTSLFLLAATILAVLFPSFKAIQQIIIIHRRWRLCHLNGELNFCCWVFHKQTQLRV